MSAIDNGREPFRIEEDRQADGATRLALVGELDLAVAPAFTERITSLAAERRPARIDLSRLEFVDSTGLRQLIVAVTEARRSGWALTVEPTLHGEVARIIELVGARAFFWPPDGAEGPPPPAGPPGAGTPPLPGGSSPA